MFIGIFQSYFCYGVQLLRLKWIHSHWLGCFIQNHWVNIHSWLVFTRRFLCNELWSNEHGILSTSVVHWLSYRSKMKKMMICGQRLIFFILDLVFWQLFKKKRNSLNVIYTSDRVWIWSIKGSRWARYWAHSCWEWHTHWTSRERRMLEWW